MRYLIVSLFFVLFFTTCSSEPPKEVLLRTEKGKVATKKPVHSDRLLTLKIQGMTCEMGCGGSIRKELKATGGVQRVAFDFVEGRVLQTAMVFYDSKRVSDKQLTAIISAMNEKQFSIKGEDVRPVQSNDVVNTTVDVPASDSKEKTVEMSEPNVILPNLLDILSDLF
jgi:copper chaperone CopZ